MKKILLATILSLFCLPLFADFCSKCGVELQNESNFCSKCGNPTAGVKNNEPLDNFEIVKKALMPINDFEIYCQAGNLALGIIKYPETVINVRNGMSEVQGFKDNLSRPQLKYIELMTKKFEQIAFLVELAKRVKPGLIEAAIYGNAELARHKIAYLNKLIDELLTKISDDSHLSQIESKQQKMDEVFKTFKVTSEYLKIKGLSYPEERLNKAVEFVVLDDSNDNVEILLVGGPTLASWIVRGTINKSELKKRSTYK